ncbi:hypothetical protein DVH24_037911 [Malus domestica]|uniref:Uncharacterized protein n=1 Tax=Malus domestica TaxID=3750 RepID=A0A498K3S7_MALDO|nr:hypothetical protein DVH24_037911 [Malus domestica]
MERLLPSLEPETYRSWAKALAIAPSATSKKSYPVHKASALRRVWESLTPIYGEATPKSRTRDLPLMDEGTCHRTKCDLLRN